MLKKESLVARVRAALVLLISLLQLGPALAQERSLVFATVDRPPFSMPEGDGFQGFTIDLIRAVGEEAGFNVEFRRYELFQQMFDAIANGEVDGAAANISITAAREQVFDFTQPIFESGIGILIHIEDAAGSVFQALFTWDLAIAIIAAVVLLYGAGMLMWFFERGRQPYFDRPAKDALFPAFWWALNLVVNGGFEERMAQSRAGRVFSVALVVSSLFIVSIFVAKITAALTIEAISSNIDSLNDLEGRKVASTAGSTSSEFLTARGINHQPFESYQAMIDSFEAGELDAVVFDRPILAWYTQTGGAGTAKLLQRSFKPENYGIVLPSGSPITEELNRALLSLRENGSYDEIRAVWFGSQP